jgi:hypothetical protein
MNTLNKIKLTVIALPLLIIGNAVAQDDRDDATAVWIVVEAQWEAEQKGDSKWIDRMLVDRFFGWGNESPAPRSKSSTRMWDRFGDQLGNIVEHELYPLEIVIHENTAIVHYLYASAFKDKDGDIEMNKGRYTDVLVRTDNGWKFIAWHGGDD